ncbi:amino acid permease-domain-containing protein [Chytriomyces sp. MP71]|nr:amino acid permease-domain-containing protein [Chytriomyces sp. MP71]
MECEGWLTSGASAVTITEPMPPPPPSLNVANRGVLKRVASKRSAHSQNVEIELDVLGPREGEFSGWGSIAYLVLRGSEAASANPSSSFRSIPSTTISPQGQAPQKLGSWAATAIAANDLVGSVLYTIGVVTIVAGRLGPLCLLLVALTLVYPFKPILQEVGARIPLNGGAYSCLIHTASKGLAAVAACCSVLDYVSTATVSAASAASYFYFEFGTINVYWASIVVMVLFGFLAMLGVRESSSVSVGILLIHVITLLLVVIAAISEVRSSGSAILLANFSTPSISSFGWAMDLFLGYCVGMLGVTGFETSSNYIEEQAVGVFSKTLSNMCILVLIFNPIVCLLALCILPIPTITANSSTVISAMADASWGRWLRILVALDAVIVLCGGVLTAFVGVAGLMESMSNDNLLPSLLLWRPKWFRKVLKLQSRPLIPITFLVLSMGLFIAFGGDVTILSLVFSMSFLSVLGMFGVCALILRIRSEREAGGNADAVVGGYGILLGCAVVVLAIAGNAINNPSMMAIFAAFFGVLFIVITLILNRVSLVRVLALLLFGSRGDYHMVRPVLPPSVGDDAGLPENISEGLVSRLFTWIKEKRDRPVAYFTNGESLHHLNDVIQYVLTNEPTTRLIIVHCFEDRVRIPRSLEAHCRVLDHVYPDLRLDLVFVQCRFKGGVVSEIAKALGVQKNLCLVSRPWKNARLVAEIKGVRSIIL